MCTQGALLTGNGAARQQSQNNAPLPPRPAPRTVAHVDGGEVGVLAAVVDKARGVAQRRGVHHDDQVGVLPVPRAVELPQVVQRPARHVVVLCLPLGHLRRTPHALLRAAPRALQGSRGEGRGAHR